MARTLPKRVQRASKKLEGRFEFLGDAVSAGDRKTLRPMLFQVLDKPSGIERTLKLWRKTGTVVDEDLRQLWRHEMRQVQRVMSYAGATDVIVDILEFVEDAENFGVLLEDAGQPLSTRLLRVSRQHWLKNLASSRPRALFWRNMQRLVAALGIVHAQGLVHGRLDLHSVMTTGAHEPDFQLTGFEWSLWLSADKAERAQARLGTSGGAVRADVYSFAEDWRALGRLAAQGLDSVVRPSGDVVPADRVLDNPIVLSAAERVLLQRLVNPTCSDNLDAASIGRAITDILADVGRSVTSRSGTFLLVFAQHAGLADAVYAASSGEIAVDEYRAQLDWIRADLDGGATLMVPRAFDPERGQVQLVSRMHTFMLSPLRQDGSATWEVAICRRVELRGDTLRIGEVDEHEIVQGIEVVGSVRQADEMRARLGPDALDWSAFAPPKPNGAVGRGDLVRRALLLVQVIEAVVKALEIYPVEVLEETASAGRRYAIIRAEPDNDRDKMAQKIGMPETAAALKRLFEDDQREAEAKWRFSGAASLGASRRDDVTAGFVDMVDHRGRRSYRFEIDDGLSGNGPFFLRPERDSGTEGVISRRLRNIKALGTRVDLTDMLDDPWRVRRSSRETLDEAAQSDAHFQDLDKPKQEALKGLWSTSPSYFVVGPPGVGKTRLATEMIRRRFTDDRASRILLTAQGHDALDHLQKNVKATLNENGLEDVIVVRSATTSDRRATSDEDVLGRDWSTSSCCLKAG